MRLHKPGKICDGLWYLGVEESGIYLIEGRDDAMLVSGGMSYIIPDVLRQLEEYRIDLTKITRHVILHCHFDHVGVVPCLSRKLPWMRLYASNRTWERLNTPRVIETVNMYNHLVTQRMRPSQPDNGNWQWRDDIEGSGLAENERIDLGELEAIIYETPGHSSCSISVYIPEIKTLLPSDAGGIPYKNTIFPTGNSNFTQFQASLERLSALDVEYLGADHYGYVTGHEAKTFIADTAEMATRLRSLIEAVYTRKKDIDSTVSLLISEHYRRNPDYFLAPEILTGIYRQMVRHISAMMDNGSETKSTP